MSVGVKKICKVVLINLLIMTLLIGVPESLISLMLSHPVLIPDSWTSVLREYYFFYDRKLAQFLPVSGQYDSKKSYVLKTGKWKQENREFSVEYSVNSQGFRDDEESLARPEIIVLGDSHAMGWGVKQHEIFASLLEEYTGMNTLNTAVVSYGTVREIMLLEELDLSQLRYIIIQHSRNDYRENRSYSEHNNSLPIMSYEKYAQTSNEHLQAIKYYPGKHSLELGRILVKKMSKQAGRVNKQPFNQEREIEDFLNVLVHAKVDLRKYQILLFDSGNRTFIPKLRETIKKGQFPSFIEKMILIDIPYGADDYFRLDQHLNAHGHQKIFRELSRYLTNVEL